MRPAARLRIVGGSDSAALDEHGDGIAAAQAQAADAALPTRAVQSVDEGDENARTRGSDGVTERDAAAGHIELLVRDAKRSHIADHLRGKRFVDLEEVDVCHAEAVVLQDLLDTQFWREEKVLRRNTDGVVIQDARDRRRTKLCRGSGARHHDRRSTIADLAGVPGRDRPVGPEGGTQFGEDIAGRVRAEPFISVHANFLLHLLSRERDDFLGEPPLGGGVCRALVTSGAEGILVGARDTVSGGDVLGGKAHSPVLEGAAQAIELHVILKVTLAKLHARTNVRKVRRKVHVLHTAGHDEPCHTRADGSGRLHHCLQSRAAHLVDGHRTQRLRQPGLEARLAGRVLADASLKHAPHHALVDPTLPRARNITKRRGNRECPQLGSGNLGQAAAKLSDGSAARREDDWVAHGGGNDSLAIAPQRSRMRHPEVITDNLNSLQSHILAEEAKYPKAAGDFSWIISAIGLAAKAIANKVRRARLTGVLGAFGDENVQGEEQQSMDVIANETLMRCLGSRANIAVVASEEDEEPTILRRGTDGGKYCVLFDPLDGSSNLDVNGPVGTIFSVLRNQPDQPDAERTVCQAGSQQVAAGYILYGPSTALVMTTGHGTNLFELDPYLGSFILVKQGIRIPDHHKVYSINEAYASTFPAWCSEYLAHAHSNGYSSRYIGALVADVHRILMSGGVFLYPPTAKHPSGKLRLLYEANPMAMIIEQAGGACLSGTGRTLDVVPERLHQRVPLLIGSRGEVEVVRRFMGA